jgi:hypothetical protein
MDLKISPEAVAGILLFALVLSAVLLVPAWHSFPAVVFSATSLFLEEYPVKAYGGEQSCLTAHFHIPENVMLESTNLRVFSEETPLFFERFDVPGKDFTKTVCFDATALKTGDNRIEVLAMGKTLFFHLEKLEGTRPGAKQASIEALSLSQDRVAFTVRDFDRVSFKPVEIWVNQELDHVVYPERETETFSERIGMEQGLNQVTISFDGKTVSRQFEKPGFPSLPFPLGIALLVISFFLFGCSLFPKQDLVEKIALSMAIVFLLVITLVFVLNYIGFLGFYTVTMLFLAIMLLLLFLFRKNLAFSKASFKKLSPLIAVTLCLFFVVPVFFHFFSFTDITYWNKFYERQSDLILQQNSIPVWDDLAYFGRTYSFSPGYFVLEAGLGWITGLRSQALFAAMLFFANAFLFLSIIYLGKSLQLSDKKTALFALFVAMSGFLFSAMSYSPRHAFSFAFFLLAIAFTIKHDKPVVTGLFLAAMAFIQFPLLVFFPLFYLFIAKKVHFKRLAKSFAFGLVFAFLLMLLPFQASPEDWGYLIDYTFYYWFIDIVVILVFFVLFSLVDLVRGRVEDRFYAKKLLFAFVAGTLIQLFVIYRWNILTTTTLALLIVVLFPEKKLADSVVERILALLAIVAFGFLLFGMSYLNVHEIVTTPVSFVAERTSTDARILSDPMFGHDITSVAQRPVLADLRVEYADSEKLEDAYLFLETKDYSILGKYDISYTFNQVDYIHKQAIGGDPKYGIIEFYPLDKIYSNGFIFVHRVRASFKEKN